ncbi:MAG TPA: glutamate-5-semialdehyde dehydrogenase [Opitutaceae bacterium]|jgi:glutamate-5-semialdehyde dehydrogenase
MPADLASIVTDIAVRARAASLDLAVSPSASRNAALSAIADGIDRSHADILKANALDLAAAARNGLAAYALDRLALTAERLSHLSESVRQVARLPDPLGEVLEESTRPNGLNLRKVRVPIGVIAVIFEARPNVTVDCAVLCLKSGNASILRGGSEVFETNRALAAILSRAIASAGLPADAVQLIPTQDRAALDVLLRLDSLIHCVIPRGGEGLIRFVSENSRVPVIKHFTGVCFVYLDRAADPAMAESICVNAKTQRPGVCNAAEQFVVHRDAAQGLLPRIGRALASRGVELRCDAESRRILSDAGVAAAAASPGDFKAEFLSLIAAVRVVGSLDEAIAAINRDGSAHSDAIVTADKAAADRFLAGVDSAAVLWNASTRFNDGFEFGFGAEIGISTDRLHARGPMGLRELCSYKWLVTGTGQLRS